jgi:hypothetical protein
MARRLDDVISDGSPVVQAFSVGTPNERNYTEVVQFSEAVGRADAAAAETREDVLLVKEGPGTSWIDMTTWRRRRTQIVNVRKREVQEDDAQMAALKRLEELQEASAVRLTTNALPAL